MCACMCVAYAMLVITLSYVSCTMCLSNTVSQITKLSVSIFLYYKNATSSPVRKHVKDFSKANDSAVTEYFENNWPNFADHEFEVLWNKFKNMCLFCLQNFVPDKVKKTAKYTSWVYLFFHSLFSQSQLRVIQ